MREPWVIKRKMNGEGWSKGWVRAWESIRLDVLHKLRIEKREAHEFRLVQVHHEQLIRGSQVRLFRSKLFIEVTHILPVLLKRTTNNHSRHYSPDKRNPNKSENPSARYSRSLAWRVAVLRDSLFSPSQYVGRTRGCGRRLRRASRSLVSCWDSLWGTATDANSSVSRETVGITLEIIKHGKGTSLPLYKLLWPLWTDSSDNWHYGPWSRRTIRPRPRRRTVADPLTFRTAIHRKPTNPRTCRKVDIR